MKAHDANDRRAELEEQRRRLQALARLSGEVAHDFNNVLQVIQSAVDLLRQRLPRERGDLVALVDMLERNAGNGAGLTRKLVAFSGHALQTRSVDANGLIAGLLPRVRELVGPAVAVATQLQPGLPPVHTDPSALETALLNLAANSRDALPSGGSLRIETRIAEPAERTIVATPDGGERYVAIVVADNGVGMAPEVRRQALDPYFTTKESGQGVGLGLSQVYGLVEQSEGAVLIDSVPGRGTCVTLYLPSHAVRLQEQASAHTGTAAAQPLVGLRVLVVEDESLIAMLVEDLLTQLGCTLAGTMSSLEKARQAAERGDIDVALLDVDLGGEPVYPVAHALQARGVPFVFMSGYGGLHERFRDTPIVQKPFDLAALKQGIELALARAG
jgi:nitrogen-specific signal transduction histidine kinase/CheY-like chemotaxis protein